MQERQPGNPPSGLALALCGIAAAYALLLLVSQRGDMAEVACMHASVACAVVWLVSLAIRTNSGAAAVIFGLLAAAGGVLWLFMAYIGLWLFGCGPQGCFT